jgi:hypothetical protein
VTDLELFRIQFEDTLDGNGRAVGAYGAYGISIVCTPERDELWISAAVPDADAAELTEVRLAPEGNAVMPPFDPARWREVSREDFDTHSFVRLERA